jgi:translation initiation factor 3 subunit B
MQWSPDGKYLARLEKDAATKLELLKVYEAPTFSLLGGASIRAVGASSYSWSPKGANLIAWWTPERENQGTSVDLVHIPTKETIRHRTLFNIEKCSLVWHPDGAFLAVVAAKAVRKKKAKGDKPRESVPSGSAGFTVEILRLKEKGVPVETLDFKERVKSLSWEPNSNRFAIVLGDGPSTYNIAFYKCVLPVVRNITHSISHVYLNFVFVLQRGQTGCWTSIHAGGQRGQHRGMVAAR